MKKFNLDVAVLGDEYVGKTAIMERFMKGTYSSSYVPTVGETYEIRTRRSPSGPSELDLRVFDTCGSIAFPAMQRVLIEQSDAFIIAYAVDSEKSFARAHRLVREVAEVMNFERVPLIIVGNKADLTSKRKVSFEKGLQLAVQAKVPFMEVSAKDGAGINDVLYTLLKRFDTLELLRSSGIDSYIKGQRAQRPFWKRHGQKSSTST